MVEIETPLRNISQSLFDLENSNFQQIFHKISACLAGKQFSLLMFLKNENNNVASFRSNDKLKLDNFINPSQYQSLSSYTPSTLLNNTTSNKTTGKNAEIELGIRPFYHQMNKLITSSHEAIQKKNNQAKQNIILINEKQNDPGSQIISAQPQGQQKPQLKINIPQNPLQQQPRIFNMPILPQLQVMKSQPISNIIPQVSGAPPSYYNQFYSNNNCQLPGSEKDYILKKIIKKEKNKQKKFRGQMKKMMKQIQSGIEKNQISVKYEYISDEEKEDKLKLQKCKETNNKNNKSQEDLDIFLKFLKFKEFKSKQNFTFPQTPQQYKEQVKQFSKQEEGKQKFRNPSISTKENQTLSQGFTETQSQSTKIGNDFIEPLQKQNYVNFKQPEEFFDFIHNCDNNSCQYQDNL